MKPSWKSRAACSRVRPRSEPLFRYDRYDTTGEVGEPGSYAFLADPADTTSAVTTYEALRDGTTTALLIHKSDAHGASQAALYDAVEAGDLFEWREADDCFVRYTVTEVPAVAATVAYREFGVRWETYAFQGCQTGSLPVGVSAVQFRAASELPLEHLGGTNLTDFAVVHGPWQLVPEGWTGRDRETYVTRSAGSVRGARNYRHRSCAHVPLLARTDTARRLGAELCEHRGV